MSSAGPTLQAAGRVAPSGVNFSSLLPLGVKGVAKSRRFQPNNGQAFTSVNNIIRIPLSTTGFMDVQHSYLSFDIAVTGAPATGVCLDGGADCIIRTLRIEGSDGSELERVDGYNVIAAALKDLQVGNDHEGTIMNAMDMSYQNPAAAAYNPDGSQNNVLTGFAPDIVNQLDLCWTSALGSEGSQKGVCIKLVSGLLNNEKYLPCGFVAGGGIVLELSLDTVNNVLFDIGAAATPNMVYTVTNVNYHGQIVEMADSFNDAFRSMLNEQSGIQWSGQTLRGHTFAFTSAVGDTTVVPIAERAKSIKAIYNIFRLSAQTTSVDNHGFTRRTWNGCRSLQYRIGSNVYPSNPVRGGELNPSEFVSELYKSVAALGDVRQGGKISRNSYVGFRPANAPGNPLGENAEYGCNGFFGLDFDVYAQSTSVLESGIDSSSLSLPINVEFLWGTAAQGTQVGAMTVNSFCLIDVLYSLDASGLLTAAM